MPRGNFTSAKLLSDGTVSVLGPYTPGADDPPDRSVVVSFYLVQKSAEPGGTTVLVDGTGGWWPQQPDWFGSGLAGELKPGPADASAIAILTYNDPPAFVTYTWNDTVVIEADS